MEEKGPYKLPLERRGRKPSSALPLLKAWAFSLIRSARSLCPATCSPSEMPLDSKDFLREEFDRWAEAGRGEGMEQDHLPITLPVLEKMRLAPTDNVLDVGCGAGWLSRRLSKLVPEGRVVGMDISDEMIRQARRASAGFDNLMFVTGDVHAGAASLTDHFVRNVHPHHAALG